MRPKAISKPPGVHASCPEKAKFVATSIAAPVASAPPPGRSPAMRRRSDGKQVVASQDGSEHRKRRAMRGRGKGDQKKQADPLAATEIRLMIDKQIERKHADAGENVSEKRARQERQSRA